MESAKVYTMYSQCVSPFLYLLWLLVTSCLLIAVLGLIFCSGLAGFASRYRKQEFSTPDKVFRYLSYMYTILMNTVTFVTCKYWYWYIVKLVKILKF